GIYNALKNKGGSVRFLIPSRLAYGINGTGSGSVENPNRINGNQCLDYWVRIVDDQRQYDELAIQKFAARNSITLSEYTRSESGLYYKITGLDTGTLVKNPSSFNMVYAIKNANNVTVNESTSGVTLQYEDLIRGVQDGLTKSRTGQEVSLLIPSHLGYGYASQTATNGAVTIPSFSSVKFDYTIKSVTNY
ncbi:MAG: hypothetical protein EOP54_21120, partial [Sphingobacteriales bacterium]